MPKTKDAFALRGFNASKILLWIDNVRKQIILEHKDKAGNLIWNVPLPEDLPDNLISVAAVFHNEEEIHSLWQRSWQVTDEEILNAYCRQAVKFQKEYNYSGTQRTIDILKKKSQKVATYFEKICRHSRRLEEYSRKWNEQICSNEMFSATEIRTRTRRIQSLLKSYADVQSSIKILQRAIKRCVTEIVEGYEKSDRKVFAVRLRQARTEAGMTQTELAKEIGMSQSTYTNYENLKCEPPIAVLKRLARILKRPTDWLLGLTP